MQARFLYVSLSLFLAACASVQKPAELRFKDYQVNRSLPRDSNLLRMIAPYADSMHQQMNEVIGFSTNTWYKKQPESALGNFLADAMITNAAKAFHKKIDAAIINYGGIRSYLAKGDIRLEHIYDIMPFDNAIVLQTVKGNILQQLLDRAAYEGGWPVAGITMKIRNKTAFDVRINGEPLNESADYTIAVSDFLANGGDQCTMLKTIARENINYLYRDALIDYVKDFTRKGKAVSASIENRVILTMNRRHFIRSSVLTAGAMAAGSGFAACCLI